MALIFHQCLQVSPTTSILLSPLIIHWTGDNISGALLDWMMVQRRQIIDVLVVFFSESSHMMGYVMESFVLSGCGSGASL